MKLKGVSGFEQHVEKIVLVSVSAVLLLVIALQLLVQPNTITVGKATAPPGRAYDEVEKRAQAVRAQLQTTDFPTPEVPDTDLVKMYRESRAAPVAPARGDVAFGEGMRLEGVSKDIIRRTDAPLAGLGVPAPSRPVANAFWSTIDPALAVANPEIAKLLPAVQPFDKVGVSCEARFDGTALRKVLEADPDGEAGPVRALPTTWYRDAIEVLALRLEREELAPTGEWTGLTEVPPLPGMLNFQAEVEKGARSQGDLAVLVSEARRLSDEARRPEFFRTIAGEAWVPPGEAARLAAGAEMPQTVKDEFRRLETKKRELDAAQRALDRVKEPPKRPGGKMGENEIINPRQPANKGADREEKEKQKKIADAEAKVKKATDELTAIQNTVRTLGWDPEKRTAVIAPVAEEAETRPLLESPGVRLWAHDATAEPGKTYRYRARVVVNNPVFGRAASLKAEQQDMARRPVIVGEPSEWSDPVEVLGDQYYFITSASEANDLDETQHANAELYRMFYGFYRKGNVSLDAGDPLVGDVRLPDPAKLLIWDMAALKALLPAEPGQEPGGGEMVVIPERPKPMPGDPTQPQIPEGAKPWDQPVRVALEVYLLDVALAPVASEGGIAGQAGRPRSQAYLRDAAGRIIRRVPDEERTGALYDRIVASAKSGETQGEPPKPTVEAEQKLDQRKPKREPSREESGGGGGGG